MANFLYHVACTNPRCGSSDACGVYDDGSMYCFSCSKYTPPKIKDRIRNYKQDLPKNLLGNIVELPYDITAVLPKKVIRWLSQYELTNDEMDKYEFSYSDWHSMLIMPFRDKERKVQMWQGRYFGTENRPKYYIRGDKTSFLDIMLPHYWDDSILSVLILVEDKISAIKVSRQFPCLCLYGKSLPYSHLLALSEKYNRLLVWLDGDAIRKSYKMMLRLSGFFRHGVGTILTEDDPKCYTDKEIAELVVSGYSQ